MKNLISRFPGTFIGILFTWGSLVIYKTYIFSFIFTGYAPMVFLVAYKGYGGTGQDDIVNLYTFNSMIILFVMVSLIYYTIFTRTWIIEKLTFTGPLLVFMFMQLFLVHPIMLYSITFSEWHGNKDSFPVFQTNETFWISSWVFIVLGFIADMIRKSKF